MADAAELLELLVCNQIIAPSLSVRLVQRCIWAPHILEADDGYASDCDLDLLPPLMVTYRLAGVDGEATEENVESLEDPDEEKTKDPEVRDGRRAVVVGGRGSAVGAGQAAVVGVRRCGGPRQPSAGRWSVA